jgi:hypothetical protein
MMKMERLIAGAMMAVLLQGCGIGYNRVLFATKSNIGLDVDSAPPTAEISIARREGVIQPSFEGGKTLPVLASFRSRFGAPSRFFFGVSSTFSTGAAAVSMAKFFDDGDQTRAKLDYFGEEVSAKPESDAWCAGSLLEPGQTKPLFFATDTTLGIRLEWSGQTAQYPSAARVGFNRKEIAWAPVAYQETEGKKFVSMSSLLAILDASVDADEPTQASGDYLQYFATGEAATQLTLRQAVRKSLLERMNPEFISASYGTGTGQQRIRAYVNSASGDERRSRQDQIKTCIPDGASYDFADLMHDAQYEAEAQACAEKLQLPEVQAPAPTESEARAPTEPEVAPPTEGE